MNTLSMIQRLIALQTVLVGVCGRQTLGGCRSAASTPTLLCAYQVQVILVHDVNIRPNRYKDSVRTVLGCPKVLARLHELTYSIVSSFTQASQHFYGQPSGIQGHLQLAA